MRDTEWLKRVCKTILIMLGIGMGYLLFVRLTGIGIPCIIYKITGLECPGCGITRAIVEISKGNFSKALEYNALCFSVYPILTVYIFYRYIKWVRYKNDKFAIWEYAGLLALLLIAILYTLQRNGIYFV